MRRQIGSSLVILLVLFMLLRLAGIKSTVAGFVLSLVVTVLLNVGLSYYSEYRSRRPAKATTPRDGDIRWREETDDRSGGRRG